MALDKLGSSLTDAIKKLFKAGAVDEAAVKELVRDIQRALLQADVNVQLVLEISKRIEERALKEKVPPGVSRREHVIKVVYEELTRFVGDKPVPLKVEPGKKENYHASRYSRIRKNNTRSQTGAIFPEERLKDWFNLC